MPADLAAALGDAFRTHDAGSSTKTRQNRWRELRRFGTFLREEGTTTARDVDAGAMRRYLAALTVTGTGVRLRQNTMSMRFGMLKPLLKRVEEGDPQLFGSALALPHNPFPNAKREMQPRKRLSATELQAILAACYEEIDEVWATFQRGRDIVAAAEMPPAAKGQASVAHWVWRAHRLGSGVMPAGADLRASGFHSQAAARWITLEHLGRHLHLTSSAMMPFYLAIAIQLAANRDPLRLIRRDCLVSNPIDEHRVMVEWLKHRTGRRPTMQRRSFDRRRRRSAPRLVEMVLAMTEPLVAHAPEDEQDCLFLVRHVAGRLYRRHDTLAGVPAGDSIHDMVSRFVERANDRIAAWNSEHPGELKRALPCFCVAQIRGSVATEHYRQTRDLTSTGAILNHKSLVTTDTYVEGPSIRRLERETITRLQKLMVAWVTRSERNLPAPALEDRPVSALFGHQCLQPVELGEEGRPRVCRHLGGCLTCPGLVVPLDAERFARALQAYRHLLAARDLIDARRWSLFYAPSLRALEQDLLPAFPQHLTEQAEALLQTLPSLPDLE